MINIKKCLTEFIPKNSDFRLIQLRQISTKIHVEITMFLNLAAFAHKINQNAWPVCIYLLIFILHRNIFYLGQRTVQLIDGKRNHMRHYPLHYFKSYFQHNIKQANISITLLLVKCRTPGLIYSSDLLFGQIFWLCKWLKQLHRSQYKARND